MIDLIEGSSQLLRQSLSSDFMCMGLEGKNTGYAAHGELFKSGRV